MTIDELIQLVTDKEITTDVQFYDYFINIEQLKNLNINIDGAKKIISDIFLGDDVNSIFTSKNLKKVKKFFKLIPSILKINITIEKIIDNSLSGKYDDGINGISIFQSIIDSLLLINKNIDLNNIYNKLIETKPELAQVLKSKIK